MIRARAHYSIPFALICVCMSLAVWRLANPPLQPRTDVWLESGWFDLGLGGLGDSRDAFHAILTMNPSHEEANRGKEIIDTLGYPQLTLPNEVP